MSEIQAYQILLHSEDRRNRIFERESLGPPRRLVGSSFFGHPALSSSDALVDPWSSIPGLWEKHSGCSLERNKLNTQLCDVTRDGKTCVFNVDSGPRRLHVMCSPFCRTEALLCTVRTLASSLQSKKRTKDHR